jgi:hypothetical protein
MAKKKRTALSKETTDDSTSQPQIPAVPPPDDPLRRAMEFDPDREYKSREMAEKRLEAIRITREMPTSEEESSASEQTASKTESDPT